MQSFPAHYEPQGASTRAPILLEDLSGPLEVLLLCVYFVALWAVRGSGSSGVRVCVLAHLMSMVFLTATFGHYVEKHWLGLDGLRELLHPHESCRHLWASLVLGGVLLTAMALQLHKDFLHLHGPVACPTGEAKGDKAQAQEDYAQQQQEQWLALYGHWCGFGHYRLVYVSSAIAIYLALGARLNAVLGGSAINPIGGGYFLRLLRSPVLVAMVLVCAGLSLCLYACLAKSEAQGQWTAMQHYYHTTLTQQQRQAQRLHEQQAAEAAAWQQQQAAAAQHAQWIQQQQQQQAVYAEAPLPHPHDPPHAHTPPLHQVPSPACHPMVPPTDNPTHMHHTSAHCVSSPVRSSSCGTDVILARGVLMRDRESEVTRETGADTSDDDEEEEDACVESSPLSVLPLGAYTPRSHDGDGYYDSPHSGGVGRMGGRRRRAQASGMWQHDDDDDTMHGDSLYQCSSVLSSVSWGSSGSGSGGCWIQCVDEPSGNTYYFNQETGEASWTRPSVSGPPSPAHPPKPPLSSSSSSSSEGRGVVRGRRTARRANL